MSNQQAPLPQQNDNSERNKNDPSKGIYTIESPLPIFSVDWSHREDKPFRLAFTSFVEKADNKISIVQLDKEAGKFKLIASADHFYPPTKIMWMPYKGTDKADLFATTGDVLRIWEMKDSGPVNRCVLNSVCNPISSFSIP